MSEPHVTKRPNPFQELWDAARASSRPKDEDGSKSKSKSKSKSRPKKRPRSEMASGSASTSSAGASQDNVVQISAAPGHEQTDKDDMYAASSFGGFGDYMRNKRRKLQAQNEQLVQGTAPSKPRIFKKLSIYVNGHTDPSAFVIRELVLEHGGQFHEHMDRKGLVTHVIATNLTPQKWIDLRHMKVVSPAWLVKSAEKGELLPWHDFRLTPSAVVFDPGQGSSSTQASFRTPQSHNPLLSSSSPAHASGSGSASNRPAASPSTSLLPATPPVPAMSKSPADTPQLSEPPPIYMTDPLTMEEAQRIPGYFSSHSKANEAAQRKMEDPAWRAQNTSTAEGFISNYYNKSRLHHLSEWKAELKDLVAAHYEAEAAAFATAASDDEIGVAHRSPSKGKGKAKDVERIILHCDFDCFFVSAGLVDRPQLRGKPVVVCHSKGGSANQWSTSEVASSSYEARKFGIKNGMSLGQVKQLCPDVTPIPYEFEKYKAFSLKFYGILLRHADDLQAVSVDEALLDISSRVARLVSSDPTSPVSEAARRVAQGIQDEVRASTGCTVSIGIAPNILLARLATRRAKPAGIFHLPLDDADEFLAGLKVADLHGFAWNATKKLEEKFGAGATVIAEVRKRSKGALSAVLGPKTGEKLWKAARGIDETPLESDKPRKSVSAELNYAIRFEDNTQFKKFLDDLSDEVAKRLQAINRRGKLLTLKLMTRHPDAPVEAPKFLGHGICDVHSKSVPLASVTDNPQTIAGAAWKLAESFGFDPKELRGIGIQIQKLEGEEDASKKDAGAGSIKSAFTRAAAIKPQIAPPSVPTYSQIDQSVLDELPEDIRREYEEEFKRNQRAAKAVSAQAKLVSQETPGAGPSQIASPPPPAARPRANSTAFSSSRSSIARPAVEDDVFSGGSGNTLSVPSFSQIDQSVFADLPEDIRREYEAEWEREKTREEAGTSTTSFSRARSAQPMPVRQDTAVDGPSRLPSLPPPAARARSLTPAPRFLAPLPPDPNRKPIGDVRHITKQLAPRAAPSLSPRKSTIMDAFHRKPSAPTVANAELAHLGIAGDVFRALPPELQRSVLAERRQDAQAQAQRSPAKAVKAFTRRATRSPSLGARARTAVRGRSGGPTAAPPIEQPKFLRFVETEDVQAVLRKWVESCQKAPPVEGDVARFAAYLEECATQVIGSDAMERCVCIMRYWKVLVDRTERHVEDEAVRDGWWAAYNRVKARLDEIAVERFGCPFTFDY
ncbi:DNA repair protein [Auricularia subglabra TFB-10046 SS5]|nr:DNA repair protein [Auricularia subglabra TFB-10046 SS5]